MNAYESSLIVLAPHSGGPSSGRRLRHYNIFNEMAYHFETSEILQYSQGGFPDEQVLSNYRISYIPSFKIRKKTGVYKRLQQLFNYLAFLLSGFFAVMKAKRANKKIFIWASIPDPSALLVAIFAKIILRVNFFYEIRDPWPELPTELNVLKEKSLVWRILKKIDLMGQRLAKSIILVSSADYFLADEYKSKTVELTNQLTKKSIESAPSRNVHILYQEEKRRFIYAGNAVNAFRLEVILQAFDLVYSKGVSEFHLDLYVDAGSYNKFYNYIAGLACSGCIDLHHFIPHEQLLKHLSNAHFYVFHLTDSPFFRGEINSNKLLDAVLTTLPIVFAANVENNIVKASGAGLICQPDDIEALSVQIIKAINMSETEYSSLVLKMSGYRSTRTYGSVLNQLNSLMVDSIGV